MIWRVELGKAGEGREIWDTAGIDLQLDQAARPQALQGAADVNRADPQEIGDMALRSAQLERGAGSFA